MSVNTHNLKAKSHILTLLGEELIGNDSLAIFELVKNAYDADAENITVTFVDLNTPEQKIIIEDDGHGMNINTIQNVWLTIGTDFKRGVNRKESPKFGRVSFGNKGVGRLAVHKLATVITMETKTEGDLFSTKLTIDWKSLIESKEYIQDLEVEIEDVSDIFFPKGHGTRVILSNLTTKNWTKKTLRDIVRKIESIKNPFNSFNDFNVEIICNDFHQEWIKDIKSSVDVLNESLYQFDFEIDLWSKKECIDFENELCEFRWSYKFNPPVQSKINKNIIEKNEKAGDEENNNYFLIGDIFKDIQGNEFTNKFLRNIDLSGIGKISGKFYVFNQNSNILNMSFGGQIGAVKGFIKANNGVKVFRDHIRVYNYGEPFDDWLSLDLDKIQRTGDHFGKKVTFGFVELNLKDSQGLIEKTNREGFINNMEYYKFNFVVKEVFRFFERVASNDKDKVEEFLNSFKPNKKIGFGDTITELKNKIKEKKIENELNPFIIRIEKDYNDMRDVMLNSGMTGLNLGIVFHEIDREMKFINSDLNIPNIDIYNIRDRVKVLIQILENFSPILKQNKNIKISAFNLVERAKQIHINRFNFHKIFFYSPLLSNESVDFNIIGPGNLLISTLSNIIDNSFYWVSAKRDLENNNYNGSIFITTDVTSFDGPAIIIADNGTGFNMDPEELIQPFKTLKPGGMGLGLYFSNMVMQMIGGKLLFPDYLDLEIPKEFYGACIALVFPKN